MAILNASGIQFGNGTQLSSKYGIVPQGTRKVFYQASAPTGWTQVTTDITGLISINNKALRVVSGLTGGTTLGTNPFTSTFPVTPIPISAPNVPLGGTVGDTTLTVDQIPSHDHGAGSQFNNFLASAGSSPFRAELRAPISYSFRSAYRQIVNFRTLVNFRQPTTVRQPASYRQPIQYRQPRNTQQPATYRRPYAFRVRYEVRAPGTFRQPVSFRRPYAFRRPYGFRVPSAFRVGYGFSYRQARRISRRVPDRRPSWLGRRVSVRVGDRVVERVLIPRNVQQPRNSQQPRNFQQPANFQQPNTARVSVSFRYTVRNRQPRNTQQPNSFRRPYSFRAAVDTRVLVNFRTIVNQRNPASYRQPGSYRQVVRYPVVNNVRYSTRVLTPGGTIRGTDQNGPQTSNEGGGLSHNHPFTAGSATISGSIDLRVQYIDVIVCSFN